eukprot:1756371-Rhodomonas_salina.2
MPFGVLTLSMCYDFAGTDGGYQVLNLTGAKLNKVPQEIEKLGIFSPLPYLPVPTWVRYGMWYVSSGAGIGYAAIR